MNTDHNFSADEHVQIQNYIDTLRQKHGKVFMSNGDKHPPLRKLFEEGVRMIITPLEHESEMIKNDVTTDVVAGKVFSKKKFQPFLLTQDIHSMVSIWCREKGMRAPDISVCENITQKLIPVIERYYPDFITLSSQEFLTGLNQPIGQAVLDWPIYVITLDSDLMPRPQAIEVTRIRDYKTHKPLGEAARPGMPNMREQVKTIAKRIPAKHNIALHTDGCWNGNEILQIVEEFRVHGKIVDHVVTGVYRNIAQSAFVSYGLPVFAQWHFPHLEAWICQRDLFPGIPRSGLNLGEIRNNEVIAFADNLCAPYILPFRDDIFDSHLTAHEIEELSLACMALSDELFAALEKIWGRTLHVTDLIRFPQHMQKGAIPLRNELHRIAKQYLKCEY